MKKRSRAYYRHQRKRIIKHRYHIYRNLTVDNLLPMDEWLLTCDLLRQPGRFSKYNLSCNCMLCKGEKRLKKKTLKDQVNLLSFQEQLKEYESELDT